MGAIRNFTVFFSLKWVIWVNKTLRHAQYDLTSMTRLIWRHASRGVQMYGPPLPLYIFFWSRLADKSPWGCIKNKYWRTKFWEKLIWEPRVGCTGKYKYKCCHFNIFRGHMDHMIWLINTVVLKVKWCRLASAQVIARKSNISFITPILNTSL